jgi:hypothetical protein
MAGIAEGAPPGFATRVVAQWRSCRQEDVWMRLAPRFALPALALAALTFALVRPGPVVPDDPALAATRQLNELFSQL